MFPLNPEVLRLLGEERMRRFLREAEQRRLLREASSSRPPWFSGLVLQLASALGRFLVVLGRRLEELTASQEALIPGADSVCETIKIEWDQH